MRFVLVVLAVLTLFACTAEDVPPRERVRFERIERSFQTTVATSTPVRPAKDNVFAIVHLTEDPPSQEDRDWLSSVMEDWDGRTYQPKFADISKSESEADGLFGRRVKTVHPNRIQLVFEVPQTSVLRAVTVPHPISLFATPVRIANPESAPRVTRRVEPNYPDAARQFGIDGLVKLEVLVMPDGTVAGAQHIHGPSVLGEAAAAAVRQWKYEPTIIDGKAVPALIEVHINFRRRV
jgi:TonB family protein